MRKKLLKVLITGGAGFIGSAFVKLALRNNCEVIVVDKITYAGDLKRLQEVKGRYKFYKTDICDKKQVELVLSKEQPQIVINFAAETHVDRSIQSPMPFIDTNVKGVMVLLDACLKFRVQRFIQISTDEVYGDILKGKFRESSQLKPNSPYSASKASAELLIKSYARTYNFPAVIIRPSNNYGPWQYPEKLIPLAILKVIKKQKVPVYAKGLNVREWLFVDDCARGIYKIMKAGKTGEIYNLGSSAEKKNIEVIKSLLFILKADESMISFVKDRPGHDLRYSLDSSKVNSIIKWRPEIDFAQGLKRTVDWYLKNKQWMLGKR
ncbi:MAG: dTDP-glucose 4,6-dehydratase [Candidatus Omnitrophota bacterium]